LIALSSTGTQLQVYVKVKFSQEKTLFRIAASNVINFQQPKIILENNACTQVSVIFRLRFHRCGAFI